MKRPRTGHARLVLPLLRQTVETWTLESGAFLLYGLFMLVASLVVGQLPLVGLVLALAVEGPLAGGLVLATRRVLLQERPEREDFLGGFTGIRRSLELSTLALIVPTLGLGSWLATSASAPWLQAHGLTWAVSLVALPGVALTLAAAWFFAVSSQVLLLEQVPVGRSLRVSWGLVRRRPFAVAALLILFAVLQFLLALPTLLAMLAQHEPTLMQWLPLLLGMLLLSPFQGILGTLLYFRLRDEGSITHAQG
jgi:hypothetical protein